MRQIKKFAIIAKGCFPRPMAADDWLATHQIHFYRESYAKITSLCVDRAAQGKVMVSALSLVIPDSWSIILRNSN